MRVVIEARALHSRTSAGVTTYVAGLIAGLREIGGAEYEILDEVVPVWRLPWWMNVTVPRRVRQSGAQLIHFTKAAIPQRRSVPTVVTIHDVIPILLPESQVWARRLMWPVALRQAARRSDHVITISEASKRDIVEYLGVPAEKITVTVPAVDLQRFSPGTHSTSIPPSPEGNEYILFVGTRDMRKNVPLLIRAFARIAEDIPHHLVIAGRQALKRDDDRRQARALGLGDRVRWLDYVAADDLPALYAGAELFVWPSVYEGWGLPPQEAMASGVPVIVSDGGSLPEVVGRAGETVAFTEQKLRARMNDGAFEEALAERMLAVLEDENKRQSMRQLGLERVRQFSWRRMAEQTLDVYRRVTHEHGV